MTSGRRSWPAAKHKDRYRLLAPSGLHLPRSHPEAVAKSRYRLLWGLAIWPGAGWPGILAKVPRGYGAVGSAPHWQCGGHGFESR